MEVLTGRPKYVCSPMVDQSELAFRQLVRRYGADLCFTPMLNASKFITDATYRVQRFDVIDGEGFTVVQFAGDNPSSLQQAGRMVERFVNAVDFNLGCPQPISRTNHYGSALLRENDLIVDILRTLSQTLSVPCTCKIRLLDKGGNDPNMRGLQGTLRLVDQIEAAGVAAITVHGRNRMMTGKHTGCADWAAIAAIKARLSIPVIANGGIEHYCDIEQCLSKTKADAVMSAEALLENPALFSGKKICHFKLAKEYLSLVSVSAGASYDFHKCVKAHVARMLHSPLKKLGRWKCTNIQQNRIFRIASDSSIANDEDMKEFYYQELVASCRTVGELTSAVDTIEKAFNIMIQSCMTPLPLNHVFMSPLSRKDIPTFEYLGQNMPFFEPTSTLKPMATDSLQGDNGSNERLNIGTPCPQAFFHVGINETDAAAMSTADNIREEEAEKCDSDADSWYRRHRIGSIESSRERRKEMQRVWLQGGLRMSR